METVRWVRFQCARCGEWNETAFDPSGGPDQTYTEDCAICCAPMVLRLRLDMPEDVMHVDVEAEA